MSHRPDGVKVTQRSTQRGTEFGDVTEWSTSEDSRNYDVMTTEQGMSETPLTINILPAIRGFALPSAVKMQHGLPRQRPYSDTGLAALARVQRRIDDGQSLWYVQASPVRLTDEVRKSARFRSLFNKVGSHAKFWQLRLDPLEAEMRRETFEAVAKLEFALDLDLVTSALKVIRDAQGWACVTDRLLDTVVMQVVKSEVLNVRSEGLVILKPACSSYMATSMCMYTLAGVLLIKCLRHLESCVTSRSCPSFFLPNVNILNDVTTAESVWISSDVRRQVQELERDPGYVMTFVGYFAHLSSESS